MRKYDLCKIENKTRRYSVRLNADKTTIDNNSSMEHYCR